MSCYALEGLPGSGKSLYVISNIIAPFLTARNSRGEYTPIHIYHNIEGLQPEILCQILGVPSSFVSTYFHKLGQYINEDGEVCEDINYVRYFYYQPESIVWGNRVEGKQTIRVVEEAAVIPEDSLVILDEAQNYFGARDFKQQYSDDVIRYLSRHRHYKHTIWWCTQSLDSVDITFRRQTQYVYVLERLENFGAKNSSIIKMYEGWQVRMVEPYAKKTFHFPAKFFPAYQSYQAGTNGEVKERRVTTNVILNNKPLMIVAAIFLICIIYAIANGNPFKKATSAIPAPKAQAAPLMGLAPTRAAQGQKTEQKEQEERVKQDSVVCIDNEFTHRGISYVVINGITQAKDKAVKYGKCMEVSR